MTKSEQKKLIKNAVKELAEFIRMKNEDLEAGICGCDLDDPDYYDYQTCHELMLLIDEL